MYITPWEAKVFETWLGWAIKVFDGVYFDDSETRSPIINLLDHSKSNSWRVAEAGSGPRFDTNFVGCLHWKLQHIQIQHYPSEVEWYRDKKELYGLPIRSSNSTDPTPAIEVEGHVECKSLFYRCQSKPLPCHNVMLYIDTMCQLQTLTSDLVGCCSCLVVTHNQDESRRYGVTDWGRTCLGVVRIQESRLGRVLHERFSSLKNYNYE